MLVSTEDTSLVTPTVRTIFVISDLHLGGEPEPAHRGFRICTHEAELAGFIDSITGLEGPAIELVINGDVVDFLAERINDTAPYWTAFHYPEQAAVDCLDRIANRSADVFSALKGFLGKGHRLVILPGNHDIELNLPAVRRRLREHVGAARGGDYEFIAHGEAYRVGDVLVEHGNRVDDMNFVDYQVLRRLCGLVSRGLAVREEFLFEPPAGSKLVVEVINDIKKKYSFIDLLKPEAEAAFPVILALEPGRRRELLKIASALAEGRARRKQQLRRYDSNISARDDASTSEAGGPARNELEEILLRTVGRADFAKPAAEGDTGEISVLDSGRSFASLLLGDRDETWEPRLHDLFDALRAFQSTNSFDRSVETEAVYLDEARNLAYGPVRHVAFGHTHLAKQVPLRDGGFYFNSGTWADILELPRAILDPTRRFGPLAELEQLVRDLAANDFSRYVLFRPTYVYIEQDLAGHSTTHELRDYSKEQWT
jgi:UDP-2,3-diacylglucosamine pyrophosphatase LpxH